MLKYTICFIKQGDRILLLNREKSDWMGSWNGVGGKLEINETPTKCIIREIFEETGIKIKEVKYKGIVTWTVDGTPNGGMYAFVAEVPEEFTYDTPIKTREGILDWKHIPWILNPENTGVGNIPKFLPKMLDDDNLYEHLCIFENNLLQDVKTLPLKETII